jgi:coenzyme F420 biosynthesis associated uncharacterized protein
MAEPRRDPRDVGLEDRPARDLVDWDLAVSTARRVAGPGPAVPPVEVAATVERLRTAAATAQGHVQELTGLVAPAHEGPVAVVDRGGWARANADAMASLLDPVARRIQRPRTGGPGLVDRVGPAVAGVEAGAMLGFLAGKVLGQYDPFAPPVGGATLPGRLLLVAPNILEVGRRIGVHDGEFALWVCLHEETHRVQFTAVPWMRDHMADELAAFLAATPLDLGDLLNRLLAIGRGAAEAVRGTDGPSLVELVQTPEQRIVLDRLSAVMALLEGHADVIMDDVGPTVLPSVRTIRARFQQRRDGAVGLSRVLRRLLGFESKLRQYRDGAAFVRGVEALVGRDGFGAVWSAPDALPSPDEIAAPAQWVARVHG